MNPINIAPNQLEQKIKQCLIENNFQVEVYTTSVESFNSIPQKVRYEIHFNVDRIIEIDVFFNGHYEPILIDLKGICPIEELSQILIVLKNFFSNL